MFYSILAQDAATASSFLTCLVGGVVVIGVLVIATAIKIIPEYQRLVVFRLGRCVGEKGPGLVLLIPFRS